jgi:hypothetical protein
MLLRSLLLCAILFPSTVWGVVFQVGPTRTFKKPCEVAKVPTLASGDTIEIDGVDAKGNQIEYIDDFCDWTVPNLTFRGVGSKRPHIRRQSGTLPGGQGIWRPTFQKGTFSTHWFRNLEMSGAQNGENAQPIWAVYTSIVLDNCYFHDNDNGVLYFNEFLPSDQRMYEVVIENSEFTNNGKGDGQTHNVYIGAIRRLIFRYNFSHDSNGGQLLKSRAGESIVQYNRLVDSIDGISNYEADFSNGGRVSFIGNTIFQAKGNASANYHMVIFRPEGDGSPSHPNVQQELSVAHNTFVNGRSEGVFIRYYGTPALTIKNNIFAGPGIILYDQSAQQPAPPDNTYASTIVDAGFLDGPHQNYYLTATSPAIDAGGAEVDPLLVPAYQYLHPGRRQVRPVTGARRDAGAYEYGTKGSASITPPTLSGTGSTGSVTLRWSSGYCEASPIVGYRVYRNDVLLAKVTEFSYTDTTLRPGQPTRYSVVAINQLGKFSVFSNVATLASAKTCQSVGSVGWCQIPNSKLTSVCQPTAGCTNMLDDRAAATYDSTRDRVIQWGGDLGHPGNELYGLNVKTSAVERLNSADPAGGSGESTAGGRPMRRRTFNNLAYLPQTDQLFAFGGTGSFGQSRETWLWSAATDTWTRVQPTGSIPNASWGAAAYNPGDRKVYYVDADCLRRYDPATNTWEQPDRCYGTTSYHYSAVIDSDTKRLYVMGDGDWWYYNIAAGSSFARIPIPATGCREAATKSYPGVAYETKRKRVAIWTGGDSVYLLDPTGTICTTNRLLGGPPTPPNGEVMSRFQYSPMAGGFIALTHSDRDAFFLRLP